jgi:uncharacterized protein (DUF885 family)
MLMRTVVAACVACWATAWGAAAAEDLQSSPAVEASAELRALADQFLAWRIDREPSLRLARGLPIEDLAHYDLESAKESSRFADDLLPQVRSIDRLTLPGDLLPLREILELELMDRAEASRHYWLGFVVTPYSGGDIHVEVQQVLHAQQLDSPAAGERYLRLLQAYARVLDEIRDKTVEQQRRGILVPRAAIPGCRRLIQGLRESLPDSLAITPERARLLEKSAAARLRRDVDRMIEREIVPRVARIGAVLDDEYFSAAPEAVGLSQYPGGSEYYRTLIRRYTGRSQSPREIHEIGERWVTDINEHLAAIREQIGFEGSRSQFHEMLRSDPRWFAASAGAVAERYRFFLKKIEPLLPRYFHRLPQSAYDVKRLDERDEPGMTYGVYLPPTPADPVGYYRFNGSGLDTRTQIGAQHLIYHELIPGHHLQVALQRELRDVHPLQTLSGSGAYVEGWAEYAASLGEGMGLYEPLDLYGHYLTQLFLAVRLVVDSGTNELGWTLAQARQYMTEQLLEGARQVDSESLRYSTDIPGQALSYGMGYQRFRDLRRRAERALGPRFDVRDFHESMLAHGAVPLPALDHQLDELVLRATKGNAARHISAVNVASIVVPARPEKVWALLLDRSNWMEGVVSAESTRGQPGQTGSRMLYQMRSPDGASVMPRAEETLLAIAVERLVLRAFAPDHDSTGAIADFRLTATRGGTRVELSTYWSEDADQLMALDELEKLEQRYLSDTQQIIETYLERLRQGAQARR